MSKQSDLVRRALLAMGRVALLVLAIAAAAGVRAEPLELDAIAPDAPLGGALSYLVDEAGTFDLEAAQARFERGGGVSARGDILSLGMGTPPVWIRLSVVNGLPDARERRLTIENAWLDRIEIYFVEGGRVVATHRAGDAQPFGERVLRERYFSADHAFGPGVTDVFLRVATDDPMVVPVYLRGLDEARYPARDRGYLYGFLYGYLIALAAYNVLIHFSIRDRRYLSYSAFLLAFIGMNLAYTGHGMMWLWPEAPQLQRWIIPVLMMAFGLTGLLFARQFLDTGRHLPRLDRALYGLTLAFVLAFAAALTAAPSQLWALRVAFAFALFFTVSMVTLGGCAVRSRVPRAPYFLLASVASALGAGITALTVWGVVGFEAWAYHAVEVGMLVDATLLGVALGRQFRAALVERMRAELASRELSLRNEQLNESVEKLAHVAATDGLTGLWNRRHFEQLLAAEVDRAGRYGQPVSLLLFDIDHFKAINDTCGHQAGDAVLCELAELVRARVRRSDTVTRWGGEEFTVLMPGAALVGALEAAEKLRADVEAHPFAGGLKVTVSVGVAQWAGAAERADRWIARADQALYEAKRAGRNRVVKEDAPVELAGGGPAARYPRLRWSTRYEVGQAQVDAQHRGLFDHANRIFRLASPDGAAAASGRQGDGGCAELLAAVDAMLEDVAEHCATEEAVLTERGALGLDAHRDEHAKLLRRARELRDALVLRPSPGAINTLVDYVCVELVANHVLRFDRQAFAAAAPHEAVGQGGAFA